MTENNEVGSPKPRGFQKGRKKTGGRKKKPVVTPTGDTALDLIQHAVTYGNFPPAKPGEAPEPIPAAVRARLAAILLSKRNEIDQATKAKAEDAHEKADSDAWLKWVMGQPKLARMVQRIAANQIEFTRQLHLERQGLPPESRETLIDGKWVTLNWNRATRRWLRKDTGAVFEEL